MVFNGTDLGFIYFFICCFSSLLRISNSHGYLTINAQGCKFWPLFGVDEHIEHKGSLVYHTYCKKNHTFKGYFQRTLGIHPCCWAFGSLTDLGLSRSGFEHHIFCMQGERSNRLRQGNSPVVCAWNIGWLYRSCDNVAVSDFLKILIFLGDGKYQNVK